MTTMTQTVSRSSTTSQQVATAATGGAPSPAAPHMVNGKVTTHVKIDEYWYDLTQWKATHPGGVTILEQMNGHDATDAFYSLHSAEATARLARLSRSTTLPAHLTAPAPPTKAALAFREFRAKLEKDGWFERSVAWEAFYTGSIYFMGILGTWLAMTGHPILAVLVIGTCMQQAGWIGHDNIHARGGFAYWNAIIMQWVNGFSREWWSQKHNTHHVFTNYIGVDADIENDPVFHLFFPEEKDDTFFRKMQHWYFVPVASVLYFSWRIQSLQVSLARMDWKELVFEAINYLWLYVLGWQVALASIYFGGFLVATIVTVTHQSEEMIDPVATEGYSFCEGQFATTRDARTSDPITEWLWGGMQYQLEHHLFPTMPKYRYSAVAPLVKQFAEANGLDYRCDETQSAIFYRNFKTLQHYAQGTAKKQQ